MSCSNDYILGEYREIYLHAHPEVLIACDGQSGISFDTEEEEKRGREGEGEGEGEEDENEGDYSWTVLFHSLCEDLLDNFLVQWPECNWCGLKNCYFCLEASTD